MRKRLSTPEERIRGYQTEGAYLLSKDLRQKFNLKDAAAKLAFLINHSEEVRKFLEQQDISTVAELASKLTRAVEHEELTRERNKRSREYREETANAYAKILISLGVDDAEAPYIAHNINDDALIIGETPPGPQKKKYLKEQVDRYFGFTDDIKDVNKLRVIEDRFKKELETKRNAKEWIEPSEDALAAEYGPRNLERVNINTQWLKIINNFRTYLQEGTLMTLETLKDYFTTHIYTGLPKLFREGIKWEKEFDSLRMLLAPREIITNNEDKQTILKHFEIIDFSLGNPPKFKGFKPPQRVIQEYQEAAGRDFAYIHHAGVPEVRKKVHKYLLERVGLDSEIEPDENKVMLGGGSSILIQYAIGGLREKDEAVGTYPIYPLYTSAMGQKDRVLKGASYFLTEVNGEKKYKLDVKDIEKQINSHTRMLIINSPNNPTGAVLSEEEITKICELAKKYSLIVLSDEVYVQDMLDEKIIEETRKGKQKSFGKIAYNMGVSCLVTGGGSKGEVMIPGARTGWAALFDRDGKAKNLWTAMNMLAAATVSPNAASEWALVPVLNRERDALDELSEMTRTLRERAEAAYEALNEGSNGKIESPRAEGAYYDFPVIKNVNITTHKEEEAFAKFLLLRHRVHILPGGGFKYPISGYFRIVHLPEVEDINNGIAKIREANDEWEKLTEKDKNFFMETKME